MLTSSVTLRIRADLLAWVETQNATTRAETGRAQTLQATLAPLLERAIMRMIAREKARAASNNADLADAAGGQTEQPSNAQQ